jgi:hypothetical protein
MRFYEIDSALSEAVEKGDKPIRVRICIDMRGDGVFTDVPEEDILEASFFALKENAGGVSARGDVLLDNGRGLYAVEGQTAGREVRVSFSVGDGLPWFHRFTFFVDGKGVQDLRGPGRVRRARLALRDRSALLRKTDERQDWKAPAIFTYSVVCDKTQPDRSLVHLMAQRAGLGVGDIDCATIPVSLPYARLTKNVWAELSELAMAYRCHLECPVEKPLVFAHSPYQAEPLDDDEGNPDGFGNQGFGNQGFGNLGFLSYTFTGGDVFYLRFAECAEQYRNAVRLKVNMPVSLKRQEIWRYADPPVFYDESLAARYPIRDSMMRDIEHYGYEAIYAVKDHGQLGAAPGTERRVLFADQIDTIQEAEDRLEYSGGPFFYDEYDVAAHKDRAIISLRNDGEGDLYGASIHGRPIVLDLNRSCFLTDTEAAASRGTAALNVTGAYFSEDDIDGRPQYEDWAMRELAERLQARREITIRTHRGVFHGRVGARVKIETAKETVTGTVNALSLRHKRDAAFQATFRITDEHGEHG